MSQYNKPKFFHNISDLVSSLHYLTHPSTIQLLDDSSSDEELVVSGKKARYDDDDLDDFVVDDGGMF